MPMILYLATDPWNRIKQKEQYLCEYMSLYAKFYYIKTPLFSQRHRWSLAIKKVTDKLSVVTPSWYFMQLGNRYYLTHFWNDLVMYNTLKRFIKKYEPDKEEVVLGIACPRFPLTFTKITAKVKYYDCMDNFPTFPSNNYKLIRTQEERIEKSADCIFVSAENLKKLSIYRGEAVVLSNGVNFDDFQKSDLNKAPDLPETQVIIGYYIGMISSWLDYDVLIDAFVARPNYAFVFVGSIERGFDVSFLRKYCNVFLLGPKDHKVLNEYLPFFNVALIPFRVNDLAYYVNPTKLYEYFSARRPVLASPLPKIERFEPYVAIYRNEEDFSIKLDQLVTKP